MYLMQGPIPPSVMKMCRSGDNRNPKSFITLDSMSVLYTEDKTDKFGWLKHISVARIDRYPTWDEMLKIKEELMGDIDCMMVMPKKEDYVNLHKNCFHIWEMPEGWGMR